MTYREVDVLDDNVAHSTPQPQPLTPDDRAVANTDNTLVAADIDGRLGRVPVRALLPGATVTRVLDPQLAGRRAVGALGRAVVAAALTRRAALRLEEVEGAVEHDDTGRVIGEVLGEPGEPGQQLFGYQTCCDGAKKDG